MKKVLTLFLVFFAYHTFGTVIMGPQDIHRECLNSHTPRFPGVMPMSYQQCVNNLSQNFMPSHKLRDIGGGRSPAVIGQPIIAQPSNPAATLYPAPVYGQNTTNTYFNPVLAHPNVSNMGRAFSPTGQIFVPMRQSHREQLYDTTALPY